MYPGKEVKSARLGESSFLSTWRSFETLGFCVESAYIVQFVYFLISSASQSIL